MVSPLAPADLNRAPCLQRLLVPNETLLYTVRFHYLRGWWMLVLALGCFAASYQWPLALGPFMMFLVLWYIPLKTNEVAVTNDRLLLRTGWLKLKLEVIEDQSVIRWELNQNVLGSLFDCGTVTIRVRETASTREIVLRWISHPVVFLEALQALQDEKYSHATA